MESNCGVLFIDLAIERGISDEDKEIPRFAYIEYLSRIEAKENGYCVLFVGAKPVIKLGRTLFWRIIPFIVQNADKKD